jgi:hypothetical protein
MLNCCVNNDGATGPSVAVRSGQYSALMHVQSARLHRTSCPYSYYVSMRTATSLTLPYPALSCIALLCFAAPNAVGSSLKMFGCAVQGGEGGGLLAEGDSTVVAAHSKVRI